MLDPIVKEVWCEALRSGEFRQGSGCLKHRRNNRTEYCCLGVLCTIFPQLENEDDVFLDDKLRRLVGLTEVQQQRLASMNDGDDFANIPKHNFSEIADYIESNL